MSEPRLAAASERRRVLWETCVAGLRRFYDEPSGILVRSVAWDGTSWSAAPPSPANTSNALIGLATLERAGWALPVRPSPMLDRLLSAHLHELDCAATACALWADAIGGSRHAPVLWSALQARLADAPSQTMALAWVLAALCGVHERAPSPDLRRHADAVYRRIAANQSRSTGLFHASAAREGVLRRRKPHSTLSSQTYTIFALAMYGRLFGAADPVARARRCAEALCARQGPQGQWWWRYDVRSGAVVEQYPVYAVNQDTAVPLAFAELTRAGVLDQTLEPFVTRGLDWLFGANELGVALVHREEGVIWRAMREERGRFEIVREMHSYHPSRCLFALQTSGAPVPTAVAG